MSERIKSLNDILSNCPKNLIIVDAFTKAWDVINNDKYKKVVCSISGGADSDVMLDICTKVDIHNKVEYVWFDTGLEYQATKDHLKELENKYGIEIKPYKAIKPIPSTCKQNGQPFLSKQACDYIARLQKHNFEWEDKPYEELVKKYCKWNEKKQDWIGCKAALLWWCNKKESPCFNISWNKWLKEFLIANPPTFQMASVCCKYAKKDVVHKLIKEFGYDLSIIGVRKAEGGVRAGSYKGCFDNVENGCDKYRPLFWYKDSDRKEHEDFYNIVHSKCYTEYGLKRTGCSGCPFGRDFENELEVINAYEPKLYKAVNYIFKDSYEYTKQYRAFQKEMNEKEKILKQSQK